MKFKIIASLLVIAAIAFAVIVGGGLDSSTGSNTQTSSDGIKLNP